VAQLSYSAQLAWQFAAEQAVQSGSEFIEPVHLLLGILDIQKIFSAGQSAAELFTKMSLEAVRVEWTELMNIFLHAKCTPGALRGVAEKQIVAGMRARDVSRRVSRSPRTRDIFALADSLGREAESSMTGLIYMLAAIFEREDFTTAASKQGVDMTKVKEAVAAAARSRLESPPTAFARKAFTSQTSSSLPEMEKLRLALAKRSAG
jgi:ATP-dependent Clp protease ATP-binding subunit ClpA